MPNKPRYLITTSDERTWKFDRPVIFLGEWCRNWEKKDVWQTMDAILAAPYGLDLAQKDEDFAEARKLEEQLFPELCAALNEYHHSQHGPRFWRMVLGHWLRRYVDVIFNRVRTLQLCINEYTISGTTAYESSRYSLAPQDSYAAIWAFNDDRWNNELSMRIIELLGATSFPVEVISGGESEGFLWNGSPAAISSRNGMLNWGFRQISKIAKLMAKENDAFITNSYLPKKEVLKLLLSLRQMPQEWSIRELKTISKPNREMRQKLSLEFAYKTDDRKLPVILKTMMFELLPVCFLEGFTELSKEVTELPWPAKPKLIFTSNNFDTDERFKLWTANKVESNAVYVTGQHGNNYGTSRYMYPSVEEVTSDKFLTWGWTDGLAQHTPTFILKTAGKSPNKYNPVGGLLLIEIHPSHRINTWDDTQEFINYFQEQQSFVNLLDKQPRKGLTLRLHASYKLFDWSEESRWKTFDPTIIIDAGIVPIQNLVATNRLVVHSYDSTGMLETLSQNIPTLAFWQNGLNHLRDTAKPYYQLLVDAGIVHLTPESAAQTVNEVWEDVDTWWAQDKVQDARKLFCNRYARVSQNPVRELKLIIDEVL